MYRLLTILLICPQLVLAQYDPAARNAFLNHTMQEAFDYWNIADPSVKFHSSFKPYLSSTFSLAKDSAVPFVFYGFRNFSLTKNLNPLSPGATKVNVQALPIADLETGLDVLGNKAIASAIGGGHIKFNVGNNFAFAGSVFGGKDNFPFYVDTALSKKRIIPEYGQGYGKYRSGYNFFDYTGYLSYSPGNTRAFNFQLGRDKHFIGDGYRSLLLSDYAPAYPFFRINTNVWRLQYNVWYSWMTDVTYSNGFKKDFKNKFGTFHYLSYNITKGLSIGLFENVVWKGTDTNQVRNFDPNYLNPVIFFRPVEYSIGSPDNSFLGLNISATIKKQIKLYGQLAIDEFFLSEIRKHRGWWGNKQGWQLGAKYINAFGIIGLKLQAEYNEVRPFTYSHGDPIQNYGHYGMPLAHPLGANFREFLGFINYHKNKREFSLQCMAATVGKDTAGTNSNVGQNIFLSYNTRDKQNLEYRNKTTQGVKTTILQSHIKFTYYIKPKVNLRLEAGYIQRSEKNSLGYVLQNPYLYVALKTSFWNMYRDF